MASPQHSAYERTRRMSGDVLGFQLEREGEVLLAAARTAAAGRSAQTLVKEGRLRVTLVAATPGTSLEEHQVSGPVTVQALRGMLTVHAAGEPVSVAAGNLVALGPNVTHRVQAIEESIFLVTIVMAEPGGEEGPPEG